MDFFVKFTAQKLVLRREPIPPGAEKPEFIQRLQDVEIVEGSAARFDVRVRGNFLFYFLIDELRACLLCLFVGLVGWFVLLVLV